MVSTPWSPGTKRVVLIACLILIGLAIWQFSIVLAPLIVAVIISYLLNPVVNLLTRRTPFKRSLVAAVVYITFLLILAVIPTLAAPLLISQFRQLQVDFDVETVSDQLDQVLAYRISIGEVDAGLNTLVDPVVGSVDQMLSPVATWAANLAVGIAGGFIWAIFIFVVGFYFLLDFNRFNAWIDSWIPPAYEVEFRQLRREIDNVWKSYFIGQVTLAIIVGTIIGVVTALLGIRSAFLLAIVAALLELIPNWGFGVSGMVGALFAYFQGSTYIPLPSWAFALLIVGFYFIMWQVDTNYLIPRIIGQRLQLSPAIVIVGIIAGASVGGALGLLLAAPIIATARVLGSYLYRRLLDLEPYVLVKRSLAPEAKQSAVDGVDSNQPALLQPAEAEEQFNESR